jgi:hypothetical protein
MSSFEGRGLEKIEFLSWLVLVPADLNLLIILKSHGLKNK